MSEANVNVGYGFDQSTQDSMALMTAGINENVQITQISFEPAKQDGTGGMVLRFRFQDSLGATFTHTEFPIDPQRVKENAAKWGEDYRTLLTRNFQTLNAKVKHILLSFVPFDKCILHGNSWEEFCQNVVKLAGDSYKDVKVRVKLVLNNKDYVSFPTSSKSPFIQNMDEESKLRINPKYDRIIPASPDASQEAEAADAFGGNAGSNGQGTAQDFNAF